MYKTSCIKSMVDPSSRSNSKSNGDYDGEEIQTLGDQQNTVNTNNTDLNAGDDASNVTPEVRERMRNTTVSEIIQSLTAANASVTIPEQPRNPSVEDEEIDHARIEQFYNSSLGAINRMRREMEKSQDKTAALRVRVGDQQMDDWTKEHCELVASKAL